MCAQRKRGQASAQQRLQPTRTCAPRRIVSLTLCPRRRLLLPPPRRLPMPGSQTPSYLSLRLPPPRLLRLRHRLPLEATPHRTLFRRGPSRPRMALDPPNQPQSRQQRCPPKPATSDCQPPGPNPRLRRQMLAGPLRRPTWARPMPPAPRPWPLQPCLRRLPLPQCLHRESPLVRRPLTHQAPRLPPLYHGSHRTSPPPRFPNTTPPETSLYKKARHGRQPSATSICVKICARLTEPRLQGSPGSRPSLEFHWSRASCLPASGPMQINARCTESFTKP